MAADDATPALTGEAEEDTEMLDPDHPILARPQAALKVQLQRNLDAIELKLSEEAEELARQKKTREEVGVSLYQVQQQLAKLQLNLEKVHDNQSIIADLRGTAETELERMRAAFKAKEGELKEKTSKHAKYQTELDALAATIKQVEAYNEQMKSEIAVTRRATYKAEEAITKLEGSKKTQDTLIDTLNERLKQQQEQLALYEAQLISQRNETDAAAQTLKEAAEEMEAIQFEKKQLLQQWNTALLGMQRRDEALQATEEALRKQREQELSLEQELVGVRKAIKRAEERNEALTATHNKLEAEVRTIDSSIESSRERTARAEEQYAMLTRTLEQTEGELAGLAQQEKTLQAEVATLESQSQKVLTAAKRLEDAVMSTLGEQMAVEKGTENTRSEISKLRSKISDKEMAEVQLQNELARVKVDTLNVTSHTAQLQAQLKRLNQERDERDALISKYQIESRRRNVEIDKKQHELDLLNRKFDALMKARAGQEGMDEDAGPLEATIVSLKREIAARATESSELQRSWIKMQTELVAVQNANQAMSEGQAQERARLSILEQKKARIAAQLEAEARELRETERLKGGLHIDMGKINRLLAQHAERQAQLADDNFLMETSFVEKLRELEAEAVQTEAKIVRLREDKERLLLDATEAERQMMLLDKKIALERETQAALDPEVGAAEARAMQREIHRMKLRYAQLQRRQEIMITDMERAIYKRDNIEAKGKIATQKKGAAPTQAALAKEVAELKKKLKLTSNDANLEQMQVQKLQQAQRERGSVVETASAELRSVQAEAEAAHRTLEAQKRRYELQKLPLKHHERIIHKLQAAAQGTYSAPMSEQELQERLEESETVGQRIVEICHRVSSQYTHLAPAIADVLQQPPL